MKNEENVILSEAEDHYNDKPFLRSAQDDISKDVSIT